MGCIFTYADLLGTLPALGFCEDGVGARVLCPLAWA